MGTPLVHRDLVLVAITSQGVGTFQIAAVGVAPYRTLAQAGIPNGARVMYRAVDALENENLWEKGEGVFSTGTPNTITRELIKDGSNGANNAVSFPAGTKYLYLSVHADRTPLLDTDNELRVRSVYAVTALMPGGTDPAVPMQFFSNNIYGRVAHVYSPGAGYPVCTLDSIGATVGLGLGAGVRALLEPNNGSFIPGEAGVYQLGTATNRWASAYLVGAPNVSSDERTKTDIEDLDLGEDFLRSLRPVAYRLRATTSIQPGTPEEGPQVINRPGARRHFGFIAQEVRAALVAAGMEDASLWALADPADPESMQALVLDYLIPILCRGFQQQAARVEALEAAVAALQEAEAA